MSVTSSVWEEDKKVAPPGDGDKEDGCYLAGIS